MVWATVYSWGASRYQANSPTVAITRDVTAMQNRLRTQEAQTLQANERAAQAISRAAKAEAALAQQASEIAELKQQMAQVLAQGLAQGMQKQGKAGPSGLPPCARSRHSHLKSSAALGCASLPTGQVWRRPSYSLYALAVCARRMGWLYVLA